MSQAILSDAVVPTKRTQAINLTSNVLSGMVINKKEYLLEKGWRNSDLSLHQKERKEGDSRK